MFVHREFLILLFPRILSENKETNICEHVTAEKAQTILTLKKFFSGLKQKQVPWAYKVLCSGTHK